MQRQRSRVATLEFRGPRARGPRAGTSPGGEPLWPVLHWFLLALAVLALPGSLPPPAPLDFLAQRDRSAFGQSTSGAATGTLRNGAGLTSLAIVESVLTASLVATVPDSPSAADRRLPNRFAETLRDPKLRAMASLALPPEGALADEATPVAFADAYDQAALAPTGALDRGAQLSPQIAVNPKLAALAALAERQAQGPRAHPVTASAFPKWTGAKERYWAHDPVFASTCAEMLAADCGLTDWRGFLDQVAGRPPAEQLALVNRWVNRVPYRADQAVWGQRDYWAAPGEFLATGGDCEDYAITKYYSLKDLGFPEAAMRIVVLNDKRRREPHAVLVVTWQGQELVLDSLDRRIRPWAEFSHYHAFYSFNEDAYWLHSGRRISTI